MSSNITCPYNNYCDNPINKAILNICRYDYDFFLEKNNVIGLGLGHKEKNNISTLEKCITVYVIKKCPLDTLDPRDIIPLKYKNFKTDVIERKI